MSLILLLSMSTMQPSWDYMSPVKTIIPWVGWVGFIGALSWIGWNQLKNNRMKSAGIIIKSARQNPKTVNIKESYTYNIETSGHSFNANELQIGESFLYTCKINGKELSFSVQKNNNGNITDNLDTFLSSKISVGAQQQKLLSTPPPLPPRDNK